MIAVIDDEELWRDRAVKTIRKIFAKNIRVDKYASGEEFLSAGIEYSIVFYDVELGENCQNGFEICSSYSKMHPDSRSIMLTSYTQFARRGYKVNAFRYIDKNNMEEEIREAMLALAAINRENPMVKIYDVKTSMIHPMYVKDVMYIETMLRKVIIHHRKYDIEANLNMLELWNVFKNYEFGIPFKSYIVNFRYVDRFEKDTLYLINQTKIPISRRKSKEFIANLIKWRNLIATT